jgi:hypothetical protein
MTFPFLKSSLSADFPQFREEAIAQCLFQVIHAGCTTGASRKYNISSSNTRLPLAQSSDEAEHVKFVCCVLAHDLHAVSMDVVVGVACQPWLIVFVGQRLH